MTTINIPSGITRNGLTINNGDILNVQAGGAVVGTVVNRGGQVFVLSGATANGTVINVGGNEYVNGAVTNTTVNEGGTEEMNSGSTAQGTVVNGGGVWLVHTGAVAKNTLVNGIGTDFVDGKSFHTTINRGVESLYKGGIEVGSVVNNGGIEIVNPGCTTSGAILNSGSQLVVRRGGVATGGITLNGQNVKVEFDGAVMSTTPISGFGITDEIDLGDLVFTASNTVRVFGDAVVVTGADGTTGTLNIAGARNYSFALRAEAGAATGTALSVVSFEQRVIPAPVLGPLDIQVTGSHDQYAVVDDPSGRAVIRDTVAGRDGDHAVQDLRHIAFTDGIGVLDPTGNAETITRLYQAALNRAPDLAGLDLFTKAVSTNGVTISALAATFTSSPEFISQYGALDNAGFVTQLYQNVLHRAPDAAGGQNFVNALNAGLSRSDVLVSIANSTENHVYLRPVAGDKNDGEAARLYQAALNRTPDSAGLALFSTALSNGATPEQIAHGFVTSAEFSNSYGALTNPSDFATQLYQNVLHRAPDTAGLQNFVNALNAGASRESILLGFSDSTENRINTAALTHDSWVFLG